MTKLSALKLDHPMLLNFSYETGSARNTFRTPGVWSLTNRTPIDRILETPEKASSASDKGASVLVLIEWR